MTVSFIVLHLLIVLALASFVVNGWNDGLIQALGRFVGSAIGFLLARKWSVFLASFLSAFLAQGWSRLLAFIVIFFALRSLTNHLFSFIDRSFKILSVLPILKTVNGFLGAIVGLAEGLLTVGGIIWMITSFNLLPQYTELFTKNWAPSTIFYWFHFLLSLVPKTFLPWLF